VQVYDKSSKWLIQRHGDSILRLAGVDDITAWKPLQAEIVQPRRLPDGVLEVTRAADTTPDLYILEIATYPEARVPIQATRDAALVYLDRDIVPEVLVVFLCPRGNAEPASTANLTSRKGWTTWQLAWKTVELWKIPAEQLLESSDIGLIPWVPLTDFTDPPETIIARCRDRIDREAQSNEHENLLAATQVMLSLRYNDPTSLERLRQFLGGKEAMIESPFIHELIVESQRETNQKAILTVLKTRFGANSLAVEPVLKTLDDAQLADALELSASSRTLAAFRKGLAALRADDENAGTESPAQS
jgi:hypothetical protein